MTDADRAEWRAAGLKAGELYGENPATLVHGKSVGDAQVQNLIELLGINLQREAQRLREMGIPKEFIEEYTRAAVESVMLTMHALRMAPDTEGGVSIDGKGATPCKECKGGATENDWL